MYILFLSGATRTTPTWWATTRGNIYVHIYVYVSIYTHMYILFLSGATRTTPTWWATTRGNIYVHIYVYVYVYVSIYIHICISFFYQVLLAQHRRGGPRHVADPGPAGGVQVQPRARPLCLYHG